MIGSFRLTQIGEFQPTRIGAFRPTQFGEFRPTRTSGLRQKIILAVQALQTGSLQGEGKDALEFLVKVFELRKRLYGDYPVRYRPDESSGYREYRHYLLLGGLLVQAYDLTGNLKYLNTLLKLDDTLLSLSQHLDDAQNAYVAKLLKAEQAAVAALAARQGLKF